MRRTLGCLLSACGIAVACSPASTSGDPPIPSNPSPAAPAAATTEAPRASTAARVSYANTRVTLDAQGRPMPLLSKQRPGIAAARAARERALGQVGPEITVDAGTDAGPPAQPADLQYNGGPLLQSTDIHAIMWGSGVTLPAGADPAAWFTSITGASTPWYQMLGTEYDIAAAPGVDGGPSQPAYTIGAGTFAGTYVDTAAPLPANMVITDEMMQAEIARLIDQHLVTNTANSFYVFLFPPGYTEQQSAFEGGGTSCNSFCAYHGSFTRSVGSARGIVYYAVVPDFSSGTCSGTGCGSNGALDNFYSTISHELAEATTDADVAEGNLAWYDNNNGEIGDICSYQGPNVGLGSSTGADGGAPVQLLWSNAAEGCRDHAAATNDTIAVYPQTQIAAAGGHASFTLDLAGNVPGDAQLYANALGWIAPTGGFSPAAIAPGNSSTAALTLKSTTPSANYNFAVGAYDGNGVWHYDGAQVAVVGAAPTITSIAPATGPTSGGTAVTITGTGFGHDATVTVDGNPQNSGPLDVAGTSFQVIMPSHAAGNATIAIINSTDTGHPVSSSTPFVYTAVANTAPTVATVEPNAGPTGGGTTVTITGTNFSPNATVTFGGSAANSNNVYVIDSQTIIVFQDTPAHAAGEVSVVVANADSQSGTLANGFDYGANPAPAIDSLSVTQGPTTGGTYVTIYGGSFSSTPVVTFGGTAGTVTSQSDGFLGVLTPAHAAGAVSVVVKNGDNQTATAASQFTFVTETDGGAGDGGAIDGGGTDAGATDGGDAGGSSSGGGDGGNDAGPTDGGGSSSGTTSSSGSSSGTTSSSGSSSGTASSSGSSSGTASSSGSSSGAGSSSGTTSSSGSSSGAVSEDGGEDGGSGGSGSGSSGCGCSVVGTQDNVPSGALAAVGLGLAFAARRRRRRS